MCGECFHLFRAGGEHASDTISVPVEEHAGIVVKVGLGDADLHAVRRIDGDGQEGEPAGIPLREVDVLVDVFEGIAELHVEGIDVVGADEGHPGSPVLREVELRDFVLHDGLAFLSLRNEAPGKAVVVCPELDRIGLEAEGQPVVAVVHRRLLVRDGRKPFLADLALLDILDFPVGTQDGAVAQLEGDFTFVQDPFPAIADGIGDLSAHFDFCADGAAGRGEGEVFLVSRQGRKDCQEAQGQDREDDSSCHISVRIPKL